MILLKIILIIFSLMITVSAVAMAINKIKDVIKSDRFGIAFPIALLVLMIIILTVLFVVVA